jgi:hypothetical protein
MVGLSPAALAVEERAINSLKENLAALIKKYRETFGVLVGTDLARELFPDYTASLECRLKFAAAVQRAAAKLADAVYEQILAETEGGSAVFTAGGTGAGKTTSIQRNVETSSALERANVIYDSNLSSFKTAKGKVEMALAASCKVILIFVHRHPVEAYVDGVLPRALEQGRTVPIQAHLSNTGHESEVFIADIDYLKSREIR